MSSMWFISFAVCALGVNGLFPSSQATWVMPLWLAWSMIIGGAIGFALSPGEKATS